MDANAPLTLLQLNSLVRQSLEDALPDAYWVQAEICEVHVNNGHCYVEFIQKAAQGNSIVAKARGTIWKNVFCMLKPYFEQTTGQTFAPGIKVLVEVQVCFHQLYGYSLSVTDIDPTYTLGDLALRRREILQRLEDEGVLDMNRELPFPTLPQRVAVVASQSSAGYGDFCNQLDNNEHHYWFKHTLFPAIMQGDGLEESILNALYAIAAGSDNYDVVVIIRGGGATSDLSGFDTYDLAAACAQFPLPVITGIGHERDDTVLDSVAHQRVKTPTAAAEFLIARMDEAAGQLSALVERLYRSATERIADDRNVLHGLMTYLSAVGKDKVSAERLRLQGVQHQCVRGLQLLLQYKRHRLQMLQQHVDDASPELMFRRGYSLTLAAGKVVRDASSLRPGDTVVTRFMHGEAVSTVGKISDKTTTSGYGKEERTDLQ